MKTKSITMGALVRAIMFFALATVAGFAAHLTDIKTVCVTQFDSRQTPELAGQLQDKLIAALSKQGIAVTTNQDDADAMLTGSGVVIAENMPNGRTRYHARAAVRLVDKDGVVLWADEAHSGAFGFSATSSLAENIARKLAKAMAK